MALSPRICKCSERITQNKPGAAISPALFNLKAMKKQTWIVGLLAALAVMLAAVGSLCGAVYSEAINPALYGEKSRAAVAQAYGMRDDAVTAYIGMDAARQNEAAKIIALYMELGDEDTPLAVDELNEKELSHMNDVRRLIALCKTVRTACISLAAGWPWRSPGSARG